MGNKTFVVQYLIKARDQFTTAANKTKVASDKMRASIRRTKEEFILASSRMRQSGAIITAAVTAPVTLLANSLKNASRDAQETRSKYSEVFKGIESEAESAADKMAKSFGLAGTTARDLLGNTGDLLNSMIDNKDEVLALSVKLNQLAVDTASFKNVQGGATRVSRAFVSALLGERESLKLLGLSVTEKDVKARISLMLSEGATFQTLKEAKARATLALIFKQSKAAIGDFSRTKKELANQERITTERTKELKEAFGNLLLPTFIKIEKTIQRVVKALTELSPEGKKTILIILGIAAVVGPLLLVLGSLALITPMISAGFAMLGAVGVAALGPVGLVVATLVAVSAVLIANWGKVKEFFSGFFSGFTIEAGGSIDRFMTLFNDAASFVIRLFGKGSNAFGAMFDFMGVGNLIGKVIGGSIDLIIRGILGVNEIIAQMIKAVTTLSFSEINVDEIKAEFLGANAQPILQSSRVEVGVNVGLDQGLKQSSPVTVASAGLRRTDVGLAIP